MSCIVLNPHDLGEWLPGVGLAICRCHSWWLTQQLAPHSRSAKIFSSHFAARWELTPRPWCF